MCISKRAYSVGASIGTNGCARMGTVRVYSRVTDRTYCERVKQRFERIFHRERKRERDLKSFFLF